MVGIKQNEKTHGFSTHWPKLENFPTLILVKIMPLLNLVAANVAGRVHLIKDSYLHDDKTQYVCHMPRYSTGDNLNLKHGITNQLWGLGL